MLHSSLVCTWVLLSSSVWDVPPNSTRWSVLIAVNSWFWYACIPKWNTKGHLVPSQHFFPDGWQTLALCTSLPCVVYIVYLDLTSLYKRSERIELVSSALFLEMHASWMCRLLMCITRSLVMLSWNLGNYLLSNHVTIEFCSTVYDACVHKIYPRSQALLPSCNIFMSDLWPFSEKPACLWEVKGQTWFIAQKAEGLGSRLHNIINSFFVLFKFCIETTDMFKWIWLATRTLWLRLKK